jgi:HAD superfamily hydrolase (TIGR01509 family)
MELQTLPAAVVFDMDGLLFDTEGLYAEALRAVALERTGRDFPMALFLRMVGRPWTENRVMLLAEWGSGESEVDALREGWMSRFEELAEARLCTKPGAPELLDTLDALRMPRAICTSGTHAEVRRNLAACGLEGRFAFAVARGDYARGKPAPDPYLLAAERLGVPPAHCLALEDSHSGVRSAAAAGMATVMVPDLLQATAEMQTLCAGRVARSLHEVRFALLAVATATFAAPFKG